jgi:hypothetical protein
MKMRILTLWLRFMIIGTVSLLGLSAASGQQRPEAASDALIVQELAPELDSVQLGRLEALNEERRRKLANEEGIGFRFEQDLDSDGQRELILLGDYVKGDRRQSFVLVARPAAGQWVRSRLFTFDQEFIIGRRYDLYPDEISVFFCTACDQGGWIEWTGSDYEFKPFPPAGVR